MALVHGAIVLVVLGGILVVATAAAALWRWRFAQRAVRTEGTVVERSGAGSGEFPIVRFTAEDEVASGGRVVVFRSSFSAGVYEAGEKVAVFYDPRAPDRATIMDGRHLRRMIAVFGGTGVLLIVLAAVLGLFLAPLTAGRDRSIEEFLAAVRSGDPDALRESIADGAALDEAFLRDEVRASEGFEELSSRLGSDSSCVNGKLGSGAPISLTLVRVDDEWKVIRAAASDPDCDISPD